MMDVTVYCDGCKDAIEVIKVSDEELSTFRHLPEELRALQDKESMARANSTPMRAQTLVQRNHTAFGDRNECCKGQGTFYVAKQATAGSISLKDEPAADAAPASSNTDSPAPTPEVAPKTLRTSSNTAPWVP